jgi:hypothetical protein
MILPASAYSSVDALAEAVAERLAEPSGKPAKRSGKAWAVCCPAHQDRNPSLTVTPGKAKAGVNVECKAGCSVESVLTAVGLSLRDLYLDRADTGTRRADTPPPKPAPRPDVPADTGKLERELQAARTGWDEYATTSRLPSVEEHTPFTVEGVSRLRDWGDIAGPTPGTNPAWRDRLRLVYRNAAGEPTGYGDRATLPEHSTAPKMNAGGGSQRNLWPRPEGIPEDVETILLVEGEKDALALWSVNVPAVGIPGVRGWRPEYAERLARFSLVVVVPDADPEGREDLTPQVVRDLTNAGVAFQVREVYPNRDDGSDISDRLQAEAEKPRGLENVLALLADPETVVAAEAEADTSGPNPFPTYSLADMDEWPDPEPIIQGVVCRAELIGLVAPRSSGKSAVALDMTLHIASGRPWNGREVAQGAVLYVAAENAPGYRKRLHAWGVAHGEDVSALPFRLVRAPMKLDGGVDAERLRDTVHAETQRLGVPVVWVVVDTVRRTLGGKENESDDFQRYVDACDLIRNETGAVVMLVHHTGNGGEKRGRGSSVWGDALAPILGLKATGTNFQRNLRLSCEDDDGGKAPKDLEPFPAMEMHLRGYPTGQTDRYGQPVTGVVACEGRHPEGPSRGDYMDDVRRVHALLADDPTLTMSGLAEAYGGKREKTLDYLRQMLADGFIKSAGNRKPVQLGTLPDALPGLDD